MFQRCPSCGDELSIRKDLITCTRCKFHLYNNPRPTNGVIFENDKREILLVKRKFLPKKGFWDIPGGFVDIGETMEEAIVREIKEELGVRINNFSYFASKYGRYLYKGQNYYTLMFVFVVKAPRQRLKLGDDAASAQWVPKTRIPYDKIAFDAVKEVLKKYIEK